MHIRVAKELGVPVTEIRDIPGHWIGAAMTMFEWEFMEREQHKKRSNRTKKSPAHRGT